MTNYAMERGWRCSGFCSNKCGGSISNPTCYYPCYCQCNPRGPICNTGYTDQFKGLSNYVVTPTWRSSGLSGLGEGVAVALVGGAAILGLLWLMGGKKQSVLVRSR